jgi:hypothetical protein
VVICGLSRLPKTSKPNFELDQKTPVHKNHKTHDLADYDNRSLNSEQNRFCALLLDVCSELVATPCWPTFNG